jgi:hypothetical protein
MHKKESTPSWSRLSTERMADRKNGNRMKEARILDRSRRVNRKTI